MKRHVICIIVIAVILLIFGSFPASALESSLSGVEITKEKDGSNATSFTVYADQSMIGKMNLSSEGLALLKSFEGYSKYPYSDYSRWSIGYGSYVCSIDDDPYEIYPNGISKIEAEELLMSKLGSYIKSVNKLASDYGIALNQNQFDALVSFTYNLGANIWKRDASDFTVKRLLISGEYTPEEMADAFYMWRNAGGKENAGLAKRRRREAALFNSQINVSDPAKDGYSVKYYIVNTNLLTVRSEEDTSSSSLGSIRKNNVIPILYTNEAGSLGFTTYAAYFGWVSMKNLVPLPENSAISVAGEDDIDEQGIFYTFDENNMTAMVGDNGEAKNNSKYDGTYSGYVYLTKYIFRSGKVYTLTAIGENAFTECSTLKKIYIPASVTHIADGAFDLSGLGDIYYPGGSYAEEYAKSSPFKGTNYNCRASHTYGAWKIVDCGNDTTPHYEESVCSVCGEVRQRTVISIYVSSVPDKTEYYQGDSFDVTGIKVSAKFDDGSDTDITSFVKYSGFDSSKLGNKEIKVKYGPFDTSFTIRVNKKTLVGISISKTPKKTTFIEGIPVDYSGLEVLAHYDNNSSEVIREYDISECDINLVGKQTVTVTYNGFKASFAVTIKAKSVKSVSIVSSPYKTEYYCGESFDFDGLTMHVIYDNGTEETVEEGFSVTGFNNNTPGEKKVRLYFGGKYSNIKVLVILNRFVSDIYKITKDNKCLVGKNTTVGAFVSAFEASDRIEIVGADGKALPKQSLVGSGCRAILWYNEDKLAEFIVSVKGDLNGDGSVSFSDYLMMNRHFTSQIKDVNTMIYDINSDGQFTLADLVCLLSEIKINNKDEQSA